MTPRPHWTIGHSDYTPYATEADAREAAEAQSLTCIVHWVGHFNLPGCKPDVVWQSTAMKRRAADGQWHGVNIHGA